MKQIDFESFIKNAEIVRKLTFILKNDSTDDKVIKSEISHGLSEINSRLNLKLNKIAEIGLVPRRVNVSLSSPAWPDYNEDISIVFNQLRPCEDLRFFITFNDFDHQNMTKEINNNSISHLIEIDFVKNSQNSDFFEVEVPFLKIKLENIKDLFDIVEDVMLDISMYYTFIESPNNKKNIDLRREFSYLKVNHALEKNLKGHSWEINENSKYVSLAGCFKNKNQDLDYGNYINCWHEIAHSIPDSQISKTPSILEQIRRHKQVGEISIRKVQRLLFLKPTGVYLLVRIYKSPKNKRQKDSILRFFHGKTCRKGKINLLNIELLNEINRYSNWVSIFKIIKP